MIDQVARMVVMLALVPMTVGLCIVVLILADASSVGWSPPVIVGICTFFLVSVSIGVWRQFVAWTWPRTSATTATTVVLFAHVIIWTPIVDTGCDRDLLVLGQCLDLTGLWVGLAAAIWWGWQFGRGRRQKAYSPEALARCTVYPSVARLVGGMGLCALIPGLWITLSMLVEHFWGMNALWACGIHAVCAAVVVAAWLLLWRRSVRWSPRRSRRTWLATCLLTIAAIAAPIVFDGLSSWEAMGLALPLILAGAWLWLTAWWWREPGPSGGLLDASTVQERLRCVDCGYSLIGLREARCPECGRQYHLEELLAHCMSQVG